MLIYKETLKKLSEKANTNFSKLSRDLGYNRNYLSLEFGKNNHHNFNFAVSSGLMSLLKCSEEDLKESPTITAKISQEKVSIVHGVDPEIIKEGFRLIHSDLQELIRLWKPTTETIKIGGDNSK